MTPARVKRLVNVPKRAPFPISIDSLVHLPSNLHLKGDIIYKGRIHGNSVHVSDPEHVHSLHSMGFFGKGMFSKSAPKYNDKHSAKKEVVINEGRDDESDTSATQTQVDASGEASTPVVVSTTTDNEIDASSVILETLEQPPLSEPLVLSFVEAFFLSYGIGCLIIQDENEITYHLDELWQRYCELDSNFVYNYVAYHHFRSKGWVPRSGIKFGADYVLYKDGPPFYHASYSIIVRAIDEETFEPSSGTMKLDWRTLSGLNRITEQAAKELLICYVIRPKDIDVTTLTCISKFKVQETLVKRWVSNEEREEPEN